MKILSNKCGFTCSMPSASALVVLCDDSKLARNTLRMGFLRNWSIHRTSEMAMIMFIDNLVLRDLFAKSRWAHVLNWSRTYGFERDVSCRACRRTRVRHERPTSEQSERSTFSLLVVQYFDNQQYLRWPCCHTQTRAVDRRPMATIRSARS